MLDPGGVFLSDNSLDVFIFVLARNDILDSVNSCPHISSPDLTFTLFGLYKNVAGLE